MGGGEMPSLHQLFGKGGRAGPEVIRAGELPLPPTTCRACTSPGNEIEPTLLAEIWVREGVGGV